MKALLIAGGVGITIYCFATHQPLWLSIGNAVFDVAVILHYINGNK